MNILEILKVIVLGIVEGITEWLPVSSTGHLILVDEFLKLDATEDFKEMFDVVIQLGAILAVIVIYFKKIWPVDRDSNTKRLAWNRDKLVLWGKILIACVPAAIIGILFDDLIDEIEMTSLKVFLMRIKKAKKYRHRRLPNGSRL